MTDYALFLKREKECAGTINIFKVSFGNLIYVYGVFWLRYCIKKSLLQLLPTFTQLEHLTNLTNLIVSSKEGTYQ